MPDSLLNDLSTALDWIVLEQLPSGSFLKAAQSPAPAWYLAALQRGDDSDTPSLLEAFPALDAFLAEAEAFWSREADGRFDGEPFMLADAGGRELPVTPTALRARGRRFLVLQPAVSFADTRRVLQAAREQALAHEHLVQRLQALQKPIATLGRLVDDPAYTSAAADAVRQQVDVLRALFAELPRTPRATTARGR